MDTATTETTEAALYERKRLVSALATTRANGDGERARLRAVERRAHAALEVAERMVSEARLAHTEASSRVQSHEQHLRATVAEQESTLAASADPKIAETLNRLQRERRMLFGGRPAQVFERGGVRWSQQPGRDRLAAAIDEAIETCEQLKVSAIEDVAGELEKIRRSIDFGVASEFAAISASA